MTVALATRGDLDSRNEGSSFIALHLSISDPGHDGVSEWRLVKQSFESQDDGTFP